MRLAPTKLRHVRQSSRPPGPMANVWPSPCAAVAEPSPEEPGGDPGPSLTGRRPGDVRTLRSDGESRPLVMDAGELLSVVPAKVGESGPVTRQNRATTKCPLAQPEAGAEGVKSNNWMRPDGSTETDTFHLDGPNWRSRQDRSVPTTHPDQLSGDREPSEERIDPGHGELGHKGGIEVRLHCLQGQRGISHRTQNPSELGP